MYSIVTIQFLYFKTFQLLYCHSAVPILQNRPVTVLSQSISYTTKRSSFCIVAVHFLYYKKVLLLYCHSAVPIPHTVQLLYCHITFPIL